MADELWVVQIRVELTAPFEELEGLQFYAWKHIAGPFESQEECIARMKEMLGIGQYDTIDYSQLEKDGIRFMDVAHQ